MARLYAPLVTSIWRDAAFVAAPAMAQRAYLLVASQPEVTFTGVVPLTLRRWAGLAPDETPDDILRELTEMEERGFLLVDNYSEEILIRHFMEATGVLRSPNLIKAAVRNFAAIRSPEVRNAVLAELPEELRPSFERGETPPYRAASGKGSGTGSEEGLANGSGKGSGKGCFAGKKLEARKNPPTRSANVSQATKSAEEEEEIGSIDQRVGAASAVLAERDLAEAEARRGGPIRRRSAWLTTAAQRRRAEHGDVLAALARDNPGWPPDRLAGAAVPTRPTVPAYRSEGTGLGTPPPAGWREATGRGS